KNGAIRYWHMEHLKGAIIGCGKISREHLSAVSNLQNVDVVGVCDLSPARAEATAERFGIKKWFTNHRDLINATRPDLVHITTPPASHFSIAMDCLVSGMNVLCEKPITITYDDFLSLKKAALNSRSFLLENYNYCFHSSILRLTDMVHSG